MTPLRTIQDLKDIPQFASEAEERAFWATHELSDALWDQAEPLEPGELPTPRAPTTPVVIQLDEATLRRAKALARRRHKGYQAVLAEIIVSHLAEEERRTGKG